MVDALEGVRAKLERARENVHALSGEVKSFLGRSSYHTITEWDIDSREAVLKVVGPEPPAKFSVLAGEILHELRSSFDHLLWQLVLANGQNPRRSNQFPICDSPEEFRRARDRGFIKGVSSDAAKVIEQLQPYHNSDIKLHTLWMLREMDNAYKHRLLAVISAAASPNAVVFGDAKTSSKTHDPATKKNIDVIGMSPPGWPIGATPSGAELLRIQFGADWDPDVSIHAELLVQIAFAEFGALSQQSLIDRLTEFLDKTALLINMFEGEFG